MSTHAMLNENSAHSAAEEFQWSHKDPKEVVMLLLHLCSNAEWDRVPDIPRSKIGDIKWKPMRDFNSFCVPVKSEAEVYGRAIDKFIRGCYKNVPDFAKFDPQKVYKVESSTSFAELSEAVAALGYPVDVASET